MKTERYVIDIDGTVIDSILLDNGDYIIMRHNQKVVDKINELYDNDNVIILHTGRHWDKLEITLEQLKDSGVKYHTLVMGKPTGDYYVDDKALRPGEFCEIH